MTVQHLYKKKLYLFEIARHDLRNGSATSIQTVSVTFYFRDDARLGVTHTVRRRKKNVSI